MATAQYSVDYGRPTPSPQRTNNISGESIEQLGKVALEGLKLRYQASKDESGDTYLLMKAP